MRDKIKTNDILIKSRNLGYSQTYYRSTDATYSFLLNSSILIHFCICADSELCLVSHHSTYEYKVNLLMYG